MLQAILGNNLIILSPGALRGRLLRLAVYHRKGRVPTGEKRVIHWFLNQPAGIVLPRGLLPRVQAIARVKVTDRRLLLPVIDFGWRSQLRPEQTEAARVVLRAGGGMVVGLPGSGKTNVGLALAAEWRQPTLWLVHTKDLASQALERAKSLFNLPPKAYGYIGEGEFGLGSHFVVGMIQSLAKAHPADLADLTKRFGAVIIDECHHTPAVTMARVVSAFPAYYRGGLTATPNRSDGLGPLAMDIIGGAVGTIDPAKLLKAGRIILPKVRLVPTSFKHWGRGDWAFLQKARAADLNRNQLVCALAAREARAGRCVLVLTELKVHARWLAAVLTQRYRVPAAAVIGPVPPAARKRVFEAVAAGRLVMVATKLADEGLDLPALDRLILAAPGRSAPRLQQQIGRVMRTAKFKRDAIVYDLADVGVESLLDQARDRMKVYKEFDLRVERQTL